MKIRNALLAATIVSAPGIAAAQMPLPSFEPAHLYMVCTSAVAEGSIGYRMSISSMAQAQLPTHRCSRNSAMQL